MHPRSLTHVLPAPLVLTLVAAACSGDAPPGDAPPANPLLQPASFQETAPDRYRVRFETSAGAFVVEVHRDWAPRGADRFYNLTRAGYWEGVPFHRVLEGFVADFGIHPDPWVNAAWRQALMPDEPVRQSNTRGRMSFSQGGPGRRTVQVFVNLDDNPELDEDGFAPFGEVVAGMEVVDALYAGYGDGPPRGEGVYQAMAIARGDEYFAEFPELDRIERARVVEGPGGDGVSAAAGAPAGSALGPSPLRPVATYSIVARDPATGELGVAVQSHWFSVGAIVPWAESGVGAVATQSFVDPRYGPLGLDLMRLGRSAPEALAALTATDDGVAVRQVAMVDAQGRVAAHTGGSAIQAAGHQVGAGYSVQANLMENPTVWPAMARAFEAAEGDLADRMVAALEAAEAEGGDIRGRQSAALVVVRAEPTGRPWVDRRFDLRVEDHPDPVAELKRLVRLQRAYLELNAGDEHVTEGDMAAAMSSYANAMELLRDEETNGEAPFWVGITLAGQGRVEEALPYLRRAQVQDPGWAELVGRLPAAGLLPDRALAERLAAAMRER